MKRRGIVSLILALVAVGGASAQADDFYKGKTIRLVVGFSAGGGALRPGRPDHEG